MRYISFLFLFLYFSLMASAATHYVPTGYPAIQAAIDAASSGDTIIVRPGTYVEGIDFKGKGVTVASEKGPGVTCIDGGGGGNVVTFKMGEAADSVLRGFTVKNGTGTVINGNLLGGGILCGPASSPIPDANVILRNTADYGGGICVYGYSSPEITNNIITGDGATQDGGGLRCEDHSMPNLTNNLFDWNTALRGAAMDSHPIP